MSIIKLEASQTFSPGQKPKSMVLENVPTKDVSLPEDGLTLFYGFRESLDERSLIMKEANKNNQFTNNITVKVDVGELTNSHSSLEGLKETRFLNLNRMSNAMEAEVKLRWKQILDESSIDQSHLGKTYWRDKEYLLKHPQFISKLREFPEFAHIEAVGFPYDNTEIKSMCRRVTLFSTEHVVEVTSDSFPEIAIEMPKLGAAKAHKPGI